MSPSIEESQKPAKVDSVPKVGDKVAFMPGIHHAFDRDHLGNHQWIIGQKFRRGVKHVPGQKPQQVGEEVVPLTDAEIENRTKTIRMGRASKSLLIPIRPARSWTAIVDAVNADGTLDLSVQGCLGGLTHGYAKVPRDDSGTQGHTWHMP